MTAMKETLRTLALEAGFSQAGFAAATPPRGAQVFLPWLDAGYAGPLAYMEREPERRMDPRRYWPEAQTLLVVSMSYAPPSADPAPGPLDGRIARYARSLDYHDVLKERLHHLGLRAQTLLPGLGTRAVVDSSPVLERAHAVAAGLGWPAKNGMLLSRELGSYTLLGALLLNREIEPDPPVSGHCGTCRRCIEACPTAALVQPGVVDARRCISTLTIELKGAIPTELRPHLSGWLFGCDICQEVCPWVKKAGSPSLPTLVAPQPDLASVPLAEVALATPETFAARWRKRPQKRSKRAGLARNAVTLLGMSPAREDAVTLLTHAMADPEPLVRSHAAWALGRQGGAKARYEVERALAREPDPDVRAALQDALNQQSTGTESTPAVVHPADFAHAGPTRSFPPD